MSIMSPLITCHIINHNQSPILKYMVCTQISACVCGHVHNMPAHTEPLWLQWPDRDGQVSESCGAAKYGTTLCVCACVCVCVWCEQTQCKVMTHHMTYSAQRSGWVKMCLCVFAHLWGEIPNFQRGIKIVTFLQVFKDYQKKLQMVQIWCP